jgi:hypothetical protein
VLLLTLSASAADPSKKVFLDPEAAGVDYRLQGEYVGSTQQADAAREVGIQVIALGNGEFEAVVYPGGLPGAGWSGEDRHSVKSKLSDDGTVVFDGPAGSARLAGKGVLEVLSTDGNVVARAEKVERKSPTLGMAPPEGAKVLFSVDDAEASLANWNNGQLEDGKYLKATGVSSKEKFGDHTLHMEFLLPFMPTARGQGRANSGLYIQHRYECQILDSFGLEGKNNECGGFYQIAAPSVNMCLPPLQWQTYDVDFTAARYNGSEKTENARVTVKHNGVVIHDNLELPKATAGGRGEAAEGGPIFLQNHGNPVLFRNIWVVER